MDGITLTHRWNRAVRLAGIAIVASSALMMGGCKNSAKARLTALEQENLELRGRYRDAQTALDASEADRAALEAELRAARDENDRFRNADYGSTGFEGIEGVTAATLATGEIVLDVAGDVLFDSGKTSLKSTSKQTLDRIASILNRDYGGRQVRIGGHTDSDPIRKSQWKTNERLSSERALAVEEYLASKGVDNGRMFTAAFGSAYPLSSKSASRRVEIVVLNQAY